MTPTDPDLARIAKLQARHQNILIVLSVVVAVSAMVAWKSMSTLHEFNELQKQSLAGRKPDAPAKTALTRRPSVRPRDAGWMDCPCNERRRRARHRERWARAARWRCDRSKARLTEEGVSPMPRFELFKARLGIGMDHSHPSPNAPVCNFVL